MSTTRTTAAAATVVVAGLLAGCAGGAQAAQEVRSDEAHEPVELSDAPAASDLVAATDRLGLALLQSDDSPTTVVSPASLAVALAMLAEGAEGQTAADFDAALGASGSERTDAINALSHALAEYDGDPGIVREITEQDGELPERPLLHLANQVVLNEGFDADSDYLDVLARSYDAGVQITDLSSQDGIDVLSEWVDEHTGGLIPESAIEPDRALRLVLQNAVLLAAAWEQPFSEAMTTDHDFTLADGEVAPVPMMADMLTVNFAEVEGWSAARLPYTEGFAADVILPPPGSEPAAIDEQTLAAITENLASAEPSQVNVMMPLLDVATEPLDLQGSLQAVGLGGLFEEPDLSGISDDDLYLQQAYQQAVLQVTEEGTVAAAVTELGVALQSAPMPEHELVADRPYLLRIANTETEWTLFLAAVGDPRTD